MTGRAEINFGGAREIHSSLDERNKMRSKKSKEFFGRNCKFKRFFRPKTGDPQKRHKIWCQSTKNTDLDLDLRSRSPNPVNFFRAQSSLGGAQALSRGGHGPGMPPLAPGLSVILVEKPFSGNLVVTL